MKRDVIQAHKDIADICVRDNMTIEMIANELEDLAQYARVLQDSDDSEHLYIETAEEIRNIKK